MLQHQGKKANSGNKLYPSFFPSKLSLRRGTPKTDSKSITKLKKKANMDADACSLQDSLERHVILTHIYLEMEAIKHGKQTN